MQKIAKLKAIKREKTGKEYVKKIRLNKTIPAIVYGKDIQPIPLEVNGKELEVVLHSGAGENVIITLQIEGDPNVKEKTVLIREIQLNPVNHHINHVDFNTISLTEKIRVKVPLHEKGEAPGIKEGGILEHVHREIEIECLPTEIPNSIDVSIEGMKIGDSIHVKDIKLPEGVKCLLDPEEKIIGIQLPKAEEEVAPETEVPAEPELIKKERKEKDEEEGQPSQPQEKSEKKPEKKEEKK